MDLNKNFTHKISFTNVLTFDKITTEKKYFGLIINSIRIIFIKFESSKHLIITIIKNKLQKILKVLVKLYCSREVMFFS